ncbi:MAG: apaG, partial [Sphingomonas bacterium]|nr:apaG [Sphingomonas bacterium]
MKALFPYAETSAGITVRVSVSYLPEQSEPGRGRWFWAYHIRLENGSDRAVQLMTRHWIITDGRGDVNEVRGEGVVGDQPLILPGDSYDYVSGCPLETTSGLME